MATEPRTTGLTYEALWTFPEDQMRREIIGGELFVTPSPATRHQDVVVRLVVRLHAYCQEHGGKVLPGPMDVYFTHRDVLEPDVLFVRQENLARVEERLVRSPPDLVVEISSPTTRRRDLGAKKDLYERFGVPEYWFVDLDEDQLEVYRLESGRYTAPASLGRGETLTSPVLPGLRLEVDDVIGPQSDQPRGNSPTAS